MCTLFGDKLWFGGTIQMLYTVDSFVNERPCSNRIDLFHKSFTYKFFDK